jgi:hypothetical protein
MTARQALTGKLMVGRKNSDISMNFAMAVAKVLANNELKIKANEPRSVIVTKRTDAKRSFQIEIWIEYKPSSDAIRPSIGYFDREIIKAAYPERGFDFSTTSVPLVANSTSFINGSRSQVDIEITSEIDRGEIAIERAALNIRSALAIMTSACYSREALVSSLENSAMAPRICYLPISRLRALIALNWYFRGGIDKLTAIRDNFICGEKAAHLDSKDDEWFAAHICEVNKICDAALKHYESEH